MKSRLLLALITIFLVLGSQACSSETPADAPISDQVLFKDDFSSPSNWDRVNETEGATDYLENGYLIKVNTPNTDIWANPGKNHNFDNVRIEVDAKKINGPDNNEFGVICRYKDLNNFYFFAISSDGYFGIFKVKDGQSILINRAEMVPSSAIKGGNDQNHIRVECNGSTLSFYVNGEFLDQQEDSQFSSGDIGLIAGTFDETGVEVLFDNFVVKRP